MKKTLLLLLFVIILTNSYCQNFLNPSVENWGNPTVCGINTPPDNWVDYSTGGIGADEGNFLVCPPTIPAAASNGNVFARMLAGTPVQGEGMYQLVSGFTIGSTYTISYDYCGTNLWGGSDLCIWHLFLDDVDTNQSTTFSSSSPTWLTNTFAFVASNTTHKIGVRAYTPAFGSAGGSAAIDNFSIATETANYLAETYSNKKDVIIYPNPTEGELRIKNAELRIESIKITNVLGQTVTTPPPFFKEGAGGGWQVDISTQPSGIYFIEIATDSQIIRKKIIKQ